MPFEFQAHIRVASCERDLVVLNLRADTYQVVMDIDPVELNAALGCRSNETDAPVLRTLRELGVLRECASTYDQIVPTKLSGFFEQRWMTPIVGASAGGILGLASFVEVLRSAWAVKRITLGGIAGHLMKRDQVDLGSAGSSEVHFEQMGRLMRALNRAFVWDFSGNRCLTYSYALVRLARRLGIPAKLVIGVRTRPFFSHAWVELHGQVVSDIHTLRQSLSVILEA